MKNKVYVIVILFMLMGNNIADACISLYPELGYELYEQKDNAFVLEDDNVRIVKPFHTDKDKQAVRLLYAYKAYYRLPDKLRENIKEIQLLDYPCPDDVIYKKLYGDMFRISGYYLDSGIYIFQNHNVWREFTCGNSYIDSIKDFQSVFVHESAHALDFANGYSDSKEWEEAVQKDIKETRNIYATFYSAKAKSDIEEFAESISQYINQKEYFKDHFPNRTKYIEKILAP